jgi:hypothetical protein
LQIFYKKKKKPKVKIGSTMTPPALGYSGE